MNKLIPVAMLAAITTGCFTNYKNDGGDADLKPTIVRDIAYEKYDISEKAVTAVDQKVGIFPMALFTVAPVNFLTVGGMEKHLADNVEGAQYMAETVRLAKNGAYALACEKAGCDSIVGTRYDVEHKWFFLWDQATVTVTGYPAKLTGVEFRPAVIPAK